MPRLLALALVASTLWWQSAQAQATPELACIPHGPLIAELEAIDAWKAVFGRSSAGNTIEWWGAPDGRWLLLVIVSENEACVLAVGRGFHLAKPRPPMEPRL